MINEKKLISLIWAINEAVEIDEWALEDVASLLSIETSEVVDLISETVEYFNELVELDDEEEEDESEYEELVEGALQERQAILAEDFKTVKLTKVKIKQIIREELKGLV